MKVYTSSQVAKICKVCTRTVCKWFDSGELQGYRIPGSADRRIPRQYLINFMKKTGIPLSELDNEYMLKVMLISIDNVFAAQVERIVGTSKAMRYAHAITPFESGILIETFKPNLVVLDYSIGVNHAVSICEGMNANTHLQSIPIIGVLPNGIEINSTNSSHLLQTFKKPINTDELSAFFHAQLQKTLALSD